MNDLFVKLAGLALLIFNLITPAQARLTFQVNYTDANGYGFRDTTPATPIGGNAGTTLGAQRTIALEYALSLLGTTFDSNVPIVIEAHFSNDGGSATAAVLAYAGPQTQHQGFTGALQANILYPAALANKLFGSDLAPGRADLEVTFNRDIDGPVVFLNDSWYYGLDNTPTNRGDIDFVSVAIHEILHGLGFISYVDVVSGAYLCAPNSNCGGSSHDIYTHFVETGGAIPADLASLSNTQRAAALGNGVTPGAIQWNGAISQRLVSYLSLSAGTNNGKPKLYAPVDKTQGGTLSHLHEDFNPNRLMEASYIEPSHDFSMAAAMLADMGWGTGVVDFSNQFSDVTISEDNGLYSLSLILENLGPDTASSAGVEIAINAASTSLFSSVNPAISSDGTCSTTDKLVSCTINPLAPSGRNTIELVVDYQTYAELDLTLDTPDVEINPANSFARIGLNENGAVQIASVLPSNSSTLALPATGATSSGGGSVSQAPLLLLLIGSLARGFGLNRTQNAR